MLKKKIAAAMLASAAFAGGTVVNMASPAHAAYDCQEGLYGNGGYKAMCFNYSGSLNRYRVIWGCFNWTTGVYRRQVGNTVTVGDGRWSSIPACAWYERPHGDKWIESF